LNKQHKKNEKNDQKSNHPRCNRHANLRRRRDFSLVVLKRKTQQKKTYAKRKYNPGSNAL
jgi:hypothetical protein